MKIESVSARAVLRTSALALGMLVALRFLWIAHAIFIVTFLGILLGLAMCPAVDFLQRMKIARGFGAPLVLVAFLAICVAIGAMIGPSIVEQTTQLTRDLPKALQSLERTLGAQQQRSVTAQITRELHNAPKVLFPLVTSVFGALGGLVLVLFIAMYIAATPRLYRKGMLHLVPHRHRERAEELADTLRDLLRQWLLARLMAMVIIGLITGGLLAMVGIKGAAALGVLAGVLEFVPFFGPIVSAIPAVGVALVDSPDKALWVIGIYLLVQQLEGNVVTPLILKQRLDVPPVLTIVAVAALGVVFGVIGMLVAEPLCAAVLVTTKMLYVQDVVGDPVKVGES
ncbi:MAG: AI-2E family transporter [Acidobacteriota bacterium]|nr:AI-2E family transporter [Acidobacteriota bacterium]